MTGAKQDEKTTTEIYFKNLNVINDSSPYFDVICD